MGSKGRKRRAIMIVTGELDSVSERKFLHPERKRAMGQTSNVYTSLRIRDISPQPIFL